MPDTKFVDIVVLGILNLDIIWDLSFAIWSLR